MGSSGSDAFSRMEEEAIALVPPRLEGSASGGKEARGSRSAGTSAVGEEQEESHVRQAAAQQRRRRMRKSIGGLRENLRRRRRRRRIIEETQRAGCRLRILANFNAWKVTRLPLSCCSHLAGADAQVPCEQVAHGVIRCSRPLPQPASMEPLEPPCDDEQNEQEAAS
eukprot:759826-Hanusia_phi.AAC.3